MKKFIVMLVAAIVFVYPVVSWGKNLSNGDGLVADVKVTQDDKVLTSYTDGSVKIEDPAEPVPYSVTEISGTSVVLPAFLTMSQSAFTNGAGTTATIRVSFEYGTNSAFQIESASGPTGQPDWRLFTGGEQVGVQLPSPGVIVWHVNPSLLGSSRCFRVRGPAGSPPT